MLAGAPMLNPVKDNKADNMLHAGSNITKRFGNNVKIKDFPLYAQKIVIYDQPKQSRYVRWRIHI